MLLTHPLFDAENVSIQDQEKAMERAQHFAEKIRISSLELNNRIKHEKEEFEKNREALRQIEREKRLQCEREAAVTVAALQKKEDEHWAFSEMLYFQFIIVTATLSLIFWDEINSVSSTWCIVPISDGYFLPRFRNFESFFSIRLV